MLRLDPPVGQVSRYRLEIASWMRGGLIQPADTIRPTVTQITYLTQTVSAVEGDVRVITTVIDSSRVDAPAFGGMGALGQIAGDFLRGQTLVKRVDARGRVLAVDVVANPSVPPVLQSRIRRALQGIGRRGEVSLPVRLVRVGEGWSDTLETELGSGRGAATEAAATVTYRVERIEREGRDEIAVISLGGTIAAGIGGEQGPIATVSGGTTGEISLDTSARRVTRMTTDVNAVVESREAGRLPSKTRVTMTLLP